MTYDQNKGLHVYPEYHIYFYKDIIVFCLVVTRINFCYLIETFCPEEGANFLSPKRVDNSFLFLPNCFILNVLYYCDHNCIYVFNCVINFQFLYFFCLMFFNNTLSIMFCNMC